MDFITVRTYAPNILGIFAAYLNMRELYHSMGRSGFSLRQFEGVGKMEKGRGKSSKISKRRLGFL